MKKAIIIYHSKTGTTKLLAENIEHYLVENKVSVQISSIRDVLDYNLSEFDYVMLGCWTSGLFVFFQNPEKAWIRFAMKLPEIDNSKLLLFTTYKILTGSMFSNMKKQLKLKNSNSVTELKSRNGALDVNTKNQLSGFIN